jgi:hypothetical protein
LPFWQAASITGDIDEDSTRPRAVQRLAWPVQPDDSAWERQRVATREKP